METTVNVKVGVCGICCETCGLYVKRICPSCPKTKEGVEFMGSIGAECPVLQCAVGRSIDVCSRDCSEFPCIQFEGWPLAKTWLEMFELCVR